MVVFFDKREKKIPTQKGDHYNTLFFPDPILPTFYSSQLWKIGSHSSHVSNIYVTAPGKFVFEAGVLCILKSYSSQIKMCMICMSHIVSIVDMYC